MLAKADTPRVYVACLAAYNNGRLHGKWIDATDADTIREGIAEVLKTSPIPGAEEWAIHDYDGLPSTLGENPDIDELASIAEAIDEHGEAYTVAYENFSDHEDALTAVTDNYQGVHDTLISWAHEYVDDTGMLADVPESVSRYFDYESFARDCELGGDIWTARGDEGLHVFWNH